MQIEGLPWCALGLRRMQWCQMSSRLFHSPTVDQSRKITLEKGHYQRNSINFRKNNNIGRQTQCDSFLILRAQLCHSCSPIFKASFLPLIHFKS